MKAHERLILRQLDERLMPLKNLHTTKPPLGWINYVRSALQISTYHLAKLLKIQQPSLMAMEQREQLGTITLESLEKVAKALGCDVVYAFVPKTSLEDFVKDHEKKQTDQLVGKSHLTMSLEKQGLEKGDLEKQRELILEEIRSKSLKALWRGYDF